MVHLLYGGTYHKKTDTLAIKRDIISSNNKKKHWPKKENKGEVGHSWCFKEGDVPWILKKCAISVAKDVILGVKASSLYGSTLQHSFIVEEHLLVLK